MMQFTQYSWITILQQQWVSIYDEMTSMDYKPLVSFENQFTGKTKLVLPFGIYLVNKERYVGVSFYILQKNGTEDLPVGKILFGTDEFPYGLYNLTIYQNNSDTHLKGQSGFNRGEVYDRIGQECIIVDIYDYESRFWEVIARNQSNHHSNPSLVQSKNDYIKEVCNAVDEGLIEPTGDAIDEFVDLIAADKNSQTRRNIKDTCYNNCQVFPNFRTYSSSGTIKSKNTLKGFVRNYGLAAAGIEGRTEEELIEQGYILYCAGNGGNKATWMRAIVHGTRLNLPVWILGYAPVRKDDLKQFRLDYIQEFNEIKSYAIQFSNNVVNDGEESSVNEEGFCVKLAGFLPQYVKPNPKDKGRPTENGLVDVYGTKVVFDPDGDCLTLSQP